MLFTLKKKLLKSKKKVYKEKKNCNPVFIC